VTGPLLSKWLAEGKPRLKQSEPQAMDATTDAAWNDWWNKRFHTGMEKYLGEMAPEIVKVVRERDDEVRKAARTDAAVLERTIMIQARAIDLLREEHLALLERIDALERRSKMKSRKRSE
jgi:hypothetical protein